MGNYNVGNETKNGSRCVCKWKGVVCLAGILISLVVGSFCVVTYGASAGEADGSESEQVDTSGNPTSDVEDGLTGTTGGYAEQEDGDLPIHSMFDQCRKVFCRYQTYPIENHLKEKEAYQSLDNTKLSWWFRRDMNHGPSGCVLASDTDAGMKRQLTFTLVDSAKRPSSDSLNLEIEKNVLKNVLYVPEDAIVYVGNDNYVYVLDEDGFRHGVQVQTGATIDGYTVIEDGLKEGDKVVIAK